MAAYAIYSLRGRVERYQRSCKRKHPTHANPKGWSFREGKKGKNKSKRLKIWWRAASSDWRDLQHRSSVSMMLLTTHEGHGELRQDRWFPTPRCPVCCRTCAHKQGGVCSVPENHQMARVVQPRDTSLPDGQPDSPRTSWQEDNMAAPFVEDQMLKRQPLLLISSHTFSVGRALYKKRKKKAINLTHVQKGFKNCGAPFCLLNKRVNLANV